VKTAVAVAVSALLALTACESQDAQQTQQAAQAVITCFDKAQQQPTPTGFPSFPLPEHTVVIGSETRIGDRVVVTAVSDQPVKHVLAYLQQQLPAAGYTLSGGEVEDKDAESDWTARSWRGRWAIREIPGCDSDTAITVLAAPSA
jgi:hypothetical protein